MSQIRYEILGVGHIDIKYCVSLQILKAHDNHIFLKSGYIPLILVSIGTLIDKYGTFDKAYQILKVIAKTPKQKILELEQKIRLLERKNTSLEKQVDTFD